MSALNNDENGMRSRALQTERVCSVRDMIIIYDRLTLWAKEERRPAMERRQTKREILLLPSTAVVRPI